MRVAERAEVVSNRSVHGQSEQPTHLGRETGTSAVPCILSKINRLCNNRVWPVPGGTPGGGGAGTVHKALQQW
jgi:hypothetical protein